jgi:lipopolysaccharide assembly outer membrane protein LptD (OstA)
MKRLVLIVCVAVCAAARTPIRDGDVRVIADQANQNGAVRHLIGRVTIESDAMMLRADDVTYNGNTGEIVTHGDAHITLK